MKTKILIIILSVFALSAKAQEQNYYEFGWNGLYGIVDADGQEIVEPTYQWKSYTLHHKSPYIALNSKNNGAFIINSTTGKSERFRFLADTYLIKLDGKEYLYAYNYDIKDAFLMDNLDLEQRKPLPKRYDKVRQSGDYLIGYLSSENEENTVDLLSKNDLNIKLEAQQVIQITDYKNAADEKPVYAFIKKNTTVFYDENLKQIAVAPKQLKSFNEVQEYLQSAVKIDIEAETYPMIAEMTGPGPDYPHINTSRETHEDGYAVFNIFQSQHDVTPFFKFKWTNNRELHKLVSDRYNNKIEAWNRKGHINELYFLFYVDVKNETILFPQKYWEEIDLHLIERKTVEPAYGKMDFDPNDIVVKNDDKKDPYKFEPFSVEREDGFYEVLQSSDKYPFKDVILAQNPVVSKSEIDDAAAGKDEYIHRPIVSIKLNEAGTLKFAEATERNIGKPIAIVINKKVISMPIVNSKISEGKIQIGGNFTMEEVEEMAEKLKNK